MRTEIDQDSEMTPGNGASMFCGKGLVEFPLDGQWDGAHSYGTPKELLAKFRAAIRTAETCPEFGLPEEVQR